MLVYIIKRIVLAFMLAIGVAFGPIPMCCAIGMSYRWVPDLRFAIPVGVVLYFATIIPIFLWSGGDLLVDVLDEVSEADGNNVTSS